MCVGEFFEREGGGGVEILERTLKVRPDEDDPTRAVLLQQAHAAGYAPVLDKLDQVAQMIAAPKRVIRGPDGKVAGVEPVPPTVQ